MGVFLRPRRPVARLAAGAATAGVAYHMGRRREQQDEVNAQAQSAYQATNQAPQAPAPQYVPDHPMPPAAAPPAGGDGTTDQLARLASLHAAGALSDDEFSAAKAKILGL
jgi:hypothetical protein